jgi:hypothetical protein
MDKGKELVSGDTEGLDRHIRSFRVVDETVVKREVDEITQHPFIRL